MLTHRITLPNGTEIEFFADDEETLHQLAHNYIFSNATMQNIPLKPYRKHHCKANKEARKRQKQARRKHR